MIGKSRSSNLVLAWKSRLIVVHIVLIPNQLFLKLWITIEENPVAPGWNSHFRRRIIGITLTIILVGWIEIEFSFLELIENSVIGTITN